MMMLVFSTTDTRDSKQTPSNHQCIYWKRNIRKRWDSVPKPHHYRCVWCLVGWFGESPLAFIVFVHSAKSILCEFPCCLPVAYCAFHTTSILFFRYECLSVLYEVCFYGTSGVVALLFALSPDDGDDDDDQGVNHDVTTSSFYGNFPSPRGFIIGRSIVDQSSINRRRERLSMSSIVLANVKGAAARKRTH